jgi:hypothetical protein
MKEIGDTVEAEEDVAFGKSCWELPLAIGHGLVAVESSSEITEGVAGWIVESDTDAVLQEAGSVAGAGLEGAGGTRGNTLVLKEGRVWIEVEASGVGTKGRQAARRMLLSWRSVCMRFGN